MGDISLVTPSMIYFAAALVVRFVSGRRSRRCGVTSLPNRRMLSGRDVQFTPGSIHLFSVLASSRRFFKGGADSINATASTRS
jgi:hypothetical protein